MSSSVTNEMSFKTSLKECKTLGNIYIFQFVLADVPQILSE